MAESVYDHLGDGTYESIKWEYAVCDLTPNGGITYSVKPAGTVKVGDKARSESGRVYDHMTAIAVNPF